MFINCPNCSALVATNLATGLPPERCPQCGSGPLAGEAGTAAAFAPAPLAPAPAPEPLRAQAAKPVFVALTPSRPAPAASDDDPAKESQEATPAAAKTAVWVTEPDPEPEPRPEPAPEPAPQPAPAAPVPPADTVAAETSAAPARPAPRFLARRPGAGLRGGDRRLVAIGAGLAALLVVQLLLADRARLATDAGWRPVVATLWAFLTGFAVRDIEQHVSSSLGWDAPVDQPGKLVKQKRPPLLLPVFGSHDPRGIVTPKNRRNSWRNQRRWRRIGGAH